jgi:hypothetical protein
MALSGNVSKESCLAKCVWEIHKHESGDPRARGSLGDWLAELERVLELPDDHRHVNGPMDGPTAARGLGDVLGSEP